MPDPEFKPLEFTPREKVIKLIARAYTAGHAKGKYGNYPKGHEQYQPEFHEWFINQQADLESLFKAIITEAQSK